MPCIIKPDMHHACLCIMPCLCLCVYRVVCFFPVASLVSFGFVPELWGFSRLCCSVFFLGSVLLPCGIPGKMTEPGYHYYLCLLLEYHSIVLPRCPWSSCQPPTCSQLPCLTNLPMQTVAWLSTLRSALLIAFLVAGEDRRCLLHVEVWLGYITLYKCLKWNHLYIGKGGRLSLLLGDLFHSCR